MVHVNITINTSKVPNLENFHNKFQKTATKNISQMVLRNLQTNSPVRHGLLRRWAFDSVSDNFISIKTPAAYAQYVNDGTGIYGPRGTPIYSKHIGHPIAFQAGGSMVYTKMIKGQKPQKFVERSINQTRDKIENLVIKSVREALQ